jgi:hypothetical protein
MKFIQNDDIKMYFKNLTLIQQCSKDLLIGFGLNYGTSGKVK